MEYCETQYYQQKNQTNVVHSTQFWADLAKHYSQPVEERGPFLTSSFTDQRIS
jgi:hypothetical protein